MWYGRNKKSTKLAEPRVNWGCISNRDNTITVDITLKQKERVLIHEVIHLISDCFGSDLTEKQVCSVSEGVYHFFN